MGCHVDAIRPGCIFNALYDHFFVSDIAAWALIVVTLLLNNFDALRIAFQLAIVRQESEGFTDRLRNKNAVKRIVVNI